MQPDRQTLSVVIIALNEERDLPGCLISTNFADEVIVVDGGSADRTAAIARAAGAKVFINQWPGFSMQWDFAIAQATSDWILIVAADERISEALRAEVQALLGFGRGALNGYSMPRRNYFLGRWMRHGGWWPQHELRLFRAGAGRMDGRLVHERLIVDGALGYLQGHIDHLTYRDLASYIESMNAYTTLEAEEVDHLGARISWGVPIREVGRYLAEARRGPIGRQRLRLLAKDHFKNRVIVIWAIPLLPLAKFAHMYIVKGGLLDGLHGFLLALMSSVYLVVKYAKLWERRACADPTAPT